MILIALLLGAILVVAAIRNSQGALFNALGQDVPEFLVWGAAIFAVGALGFVPGVKPVARGLVALVLIVIVLSNYSAILAGFEALAASNTSTGGQANAGAPTPATGAAPGGASPSVASPPQAGGLASGAQLLGAPQGPPAPTFDEAVHGLAQTFGFGGGA